MGRTRETRRSEGALVVAVDAHQAHVPAVRPWLLKTALVLTGVGVLTASSWVSVPFYPVPLTLQTLAVLLVGGLLGPRMGVAAVTSYLALGLVGAPVFHNGLGGLALLAGPTGGYLAGFVPAAFLMGLAGQGSRSLSAVRWGAPLRWALVAAGAVAAEVAIYSLGVPWLAFTTATDTGTAIAVGLAPFLVGDLVKMSIAVLVVCGGKSLLERRGL